MQKIKKLSAHEAQKIAAGEVIERPANALKELLENAIDAGSTKVTIYVKDAGKELIRVVDNGCGMSPEDAELCFEQYATSKITHVDQLQEIETFGFRGEALASITAVAKVTLVTKEAHAGEGVKICVEQNSIVSREIVSAITGTDISIKDLFYNIPARRKFLKKRETEWSQIKHVFFAACLAHLTIDFKLYSDDVLMYVCPSIASLHERWQQLSDHTMSKHMFPVDHTFGAMQLKGLVSDQQVHRYDRSSIYIYVNNRWVHDAALTRAFIKGYQNVLQPARYPAGCLFLEIDLKEVDINIHPRKEEVQFLHPRLVEREMQQCITKGLNTKLSEQLQKSPVQVATIDAVAAMDHYGTSLRPTPEPSTLFNFDAFLQKTPFKSMDMEHSISIGSQAVSIAHKEATKFEEPLIEQKNIEIPQHFDLIGQYKRTYLLLEQEQGLFLVDQHAAHERILYEQFIVQHGQAAKVQLLFPQIIVLPSEDLSLILSYTDLFAQYGIDFEQFGPDSISIHATPIHLKHINCTDIIKQAACDIRDLQGTGAEQFEKAMQKKFYADMACKAAVKAGDILNMEQMQQLLSDLDQAQNRFSCPHGRPTGWLLHHEEIKKKFKRDYRSSSEDAL